MSNLRTTVCECGEVMDSKAMCGGLERVTQHGFYGNRVTHFAKGICPKCGKAYKLYVKPASGGWDVIDMEEAEMPKKKKKSEEE